jgi:hypothetical protein
MDIYGPLRVALFIYECFRFMIMIGMFAVLGPGQGMLGGSAFGEDMFPYVIYMVPHALFPLMTCFLWIRFSVYKSYIALYIAGKTIMVVGIIGWGIFSLKSIITFNSMDWTSIVAGLTLLLALTDVCSILGGLILQTKLHRLETQVPKSGGIGCV